jgi:hypothetical protein
MNATTVRMTYTLGRGCEELIVASACPPYDSDEPPHIVGEHRHQSKRRKLQGISGEFKPEYS